MNNSSKNNFKPYTCHHLQIAHHPAPIWSLKHETNVVASIDTTPLITIWKQDEQSSGETKVKQWRPTVLGQHKENRSFYHKDIISDVHLFVMNEKVHVATSDASDEIFLWDIEIMDPIWSFRGDLMWYTH